MRISPIRSWLVVATLTPLLAVALAPGASACPFCDGGPSGVNEVRQEVFDKNFWPRVAATVAPFPVLAGIVALIYFGPTTFKRRRPGAADSGVQANSQPR